jgi:hypothetical protein
LPPAQYVESCSYIPQQAPQPMAYSTCSAPKTISTEYRTKQPGIKVYNYPAVPR